MRIKANIPKIGGPRGDRGQVIAEMAFLIPLFLFLAFGIFETAKIFYLYHTMQKAVRGGAGVLARSSNVNYCDEGDPIITDVKNLIVYGNLDPSANLPIVQGFAPELINVLPERLTVDNTAISCVCSADPDSCDPTQGGRAPDFVVVNFVNPFLVDMAFPYIGQIPLTVSVRMPVTGN